MLGFFNYLDSSINLVVYRLVSLKFFYAQKKPDGGNCDSKHCNVTCDSSDRSHSSKKEVSARTEGTGKPHTGHTKSLKGLG